MWAGNYHGVVELVAPSRSVLHRVGVVRWFALCLLGCALHHRVEPTEFDSAVADAADAPDSGDTADAGVEDAGVEDASVEDLDIVLQNDVYRLFGARYEDRTTLVVGGERRYDATCDCLTMPPISLWDVRAELPPSLAALGALEGTEGADPARVARHEDFIVVAFKPRERAGELLLADLRAGGEVSWRMPLDEELSDSYNVFAFLAMNAEKVLVFHDSERAMIGRLYRRVGGELVFDRTVFEGDRGVPRLRVAARVATADAEVRALLEEVHGRDAIALAMDASLLAQARENVLVDLERNALVINGVVRETVDAVPISTTYGTDLAIRGGRGLFAVSAGTGLRWVIWSDEDPGPWRQPDSLRFFGAFPGAYLDARQEGVFFIGPALGVERSELRFVGQLR